MSYHTLEKSTNKREKRDYCRVCFILCVVCLIAKINFDLTQHFGDYFMRQAAARIEDELSQVSNKLTIDN